MRRWALYIISVCSLAVYVLSLNRGFMEWWADFRTYQWHSAYARARYGDLYSTSFLPGYMDTAYMPLKKYDAHGASIDLYILHDSYLANKVKKENFQGVHKLTTVDYRDGGNFIQLDRGRKNILIIESSERTAFWRFHDTATILSGICMKVVKPTQVAVEETSEPIADYFFNPNINQNLEFSLYDYEWFIPIKECKARINYSLFGRLPKDVKVSTDKNYLLLNETVDPSLTTSSFCQLDEATLLRITEDVNYVNNYYRARGFDEVYFSVIPNPVSIIDPGRMTYNHRVEALEKHPALRTQYISVYDTFKNTKEIIYRRDDSHWNGKGLQLWVNEVNQRLQP